VLSGFLGGRWGALAVGLDDKGVGEGFRWRGVRGGLSGAYRAAEAVSVIVDLEVFFRGVLSRVLFGVGIACWVGDFPSEAGFEGVSGAVG
jgi:hypothetical protein